MIRGETWNVITESLDLLRNAAATDQRQPTARSTTPCRQVDRHIVGRRHQRADELLIWPAATSIGRTAWRLLREGGRGTGGPDLGARPSEALPGEISGACSKDMGGTIRLVGPIRAAHHVWGENSAPGGPKV